VFPDANDAPARIAELSRGVDIAPLVVCDLRAPPGAVGCRPSAMNRASVPETPINEYRDSSAYERQVWSPPSARYLSIDSVAQPKFVDSCAQR
jgi:hypothetical protein